VIGGMLLPRMMLMMEVVMVVVVARFRISLLLRTPTTVI
jgi:hypothetical protein